MFSLSTTTLSLPFRATTIYRPNFLLLLLAIAEAPSLLTTVLTSGMVSELTSLALFGFCLLGQVILLWPYLPY